MFYQTQVSAQSLINMDMKVSEMESLTLMEEHSLDTSTSKMLKKFLSHSLAHPIRLQTLDLAHLNLSRIV